MRVLGLETSCDETGLALYDSERGLLGQVLYSQVKLHAEYGGVVPELASRDHVRKLIPLLEMLLEQTKTDKHQIDAVAYTRGPGLMGALMTGALFGRSLAYALKIPAIGVHHMEGHLLAPLLSEQPPEFPFVALLVSGGHSQLMAVQGIGQYELLGESIDDAAGEAFDKCAKVMGLPYPGGPHVDRLAKEGNPKAFKLNKPQISGYDYSFSGLKTSFLYLLRDEIKKNPDFVQENTADLCASLQATIIEILMKKLLKAAEELNIRQVAVAGGVSANSGLRNAFHDYAQKYGWEIFIPPFAFTTDNAAMIAITGYYKYLRGEFSSLEDVPYARVSNLLV